MEDLNLQRKCVHSYLISTGVYESFKQEDCPYCLGSGIIRDPIFLEDGSLHMISEESKLKQDIEKIFIEELRTSGFGFQYADVTGAVVNDITKTRLEQSLVSALQFLYNLQQEAEQEGQFIHPTEKIDTIGDIQIIQDPADPRKYDVSVSVVTEAAENIELNITIPLE